MKKIILVGYMAVGKTTTARLLSKQIDFKVVDLDKLIEEKVGLLITEIFAKKGEVFFRKIEHQIFREIVENDEKLIISTGGGTPCYADNHLLLNLESNISVYLKASVDTIFQRLKCAKKERPLTANISAGELQEFVAKHLFERSHFYNQATFTITTDNKTPEEIVEQIIQLLD